LKADDKSGWAERPAEVSDGQRVAQWSLIRWRGSYDSATTPKQDQTSHDHTYHTQFPSTRLGLAVLIGGGASPFWRELAIGTTTPRCAGPSIDYSDSQLFSFKPLTMHEGVVSHQPHGTQLK